MYMRNLAFDSAETGQSLHPFSDKEKMAGPGWMVTVKKSNNLSFQIPEATSITRAAGFTLPRIIRLLLITLGYTKLPGPNIKLQKNR
jgi:hypothetical protein